MKRRWSIIKQYTPWLLLLLGINGLAALLLWIADAQAFYALIIVMILSTVLLFSSVCSVLVYLGLKKEKAFIAFLSNPDEYHEELLLKTVSGAQVEAVHLLALTLRDKIDAYNQVQAQLLDYEEYAEAWVHEAKTPLSLLALLLDNRRGELPEKVGFKLDYIQNRMQEFVNQMLYYARLKGVRKDYFFEYINIRPCIEEVLEDYKPLLEEKGFHIHIQVSHGNVYTDSRGFHFLLGQIISNAIKYSRKEPVIYFEFAKEMNSCVLSVRDNGLGVRDCDLPYIFEKGFTGNSGEGRKKATGIGLYLAKEIAGDLNLSLIAKSQWKQGFEMQLIFPVVDK